MAIKTCGRCSLGCEWQGIPFSPDKDCSWLAITERRNGEKPITGVVTKTVALFSTGKGKGRMAIPNKVVTTLAKKATHKESGSGGVTASKEMPIDPLTQKIRELAQKGIDGKEVSTRKIAEALEAEGIFVSHMTVARRLQGKLGL